MGLHRMFLEKGKKEGDILMIRRQLARRFGKIPVWDISSITVSELQYGVSKSKQREKNQQHLNEFLLPMKILAFDENAAKCYGDIRYQLEKQGQIIGPDVTAGNNCKIQNNVSVFKGVTLEDGVFCGPSMVFTNVYNAN